jgi:hypothetical protein
MRVLPGTHEIGRITRIALPFPKTTRQILKAMGDGFSWTTSDFIKLFPKNMVFRSGNDFYTRCQELKLLMREAEKMPPEQLRSPQG